MFVYIFFINADACTVVHTTCSMETVTLAIPETVGIVNPLEPGDCYNYHQV